VNTKAVDVQVTELWVEEVPWLPFLRRTRHQEEEAWDHRSLINVEANSTKDLDRSMHPADPAAIEYPRGMRVRAVVQLATGRKVRSKVFRRPRPKAPWVNLGVDEKRMERWRRSDGSEEFAHSVPPKPDPDAIDIKKVLER
jgi:hypothetical protein